VAEELVMSVFRTPDPALTLNVARRMVAFGAHP
jgi:hypothetical protein